MQHYLLGIKTDREADYYILVGESHKDIEYLKNSLTENDDYLIYKPISEKEALSIEEDNLTYKGVRNRFQLFNNTVHA